MSIRTLIYIFLFIPIIGSAQIDLDKEYGYEQLEIILNKARESNDHQMLADVYFKLAEFEKEKLNNLNQAFEYYTRSRDYYKIVENESQLFAIDRIIINKSMDAGLFSESIKSLNKLESNLNPKIDQSKMILIYADLSKAYHGLGDIEKEIYYQNLALELNKSEGNRLIEMELLLARIKSYINIAEYDSALYISNNVMAKAIDTEEKEIACEVLLEKGHLFYRLKNFDAALDAYDEAQIFCNSKPYNDERLKLYKGLAQTFEAFNKYDQAYLFSSKYAALNDSILNQERNNSINNLTYKFSVKEKNKELKLLELENTYAKERNSQQRRALWVLGLGLAALAIFLYYTIYVYNQRIKANRLINVQREEINTQRISKLEDDIKINSMQSMLEGQEIERERIAKDLHDSLGGVLSTIKLQFDAVQSKVKSVSKIEEYRRAHRLIDSAVDEVRSISQNLQPSSLENLGLIPAIKDLINRFDGEGYPEIDFQYYSFPHSLNKMSSLYIYRMVQELLHNTIKHAKATEIMIQLTKDEDELVIHFEDDGIGFDPNKTRKGGMGMENLRSRANYLKGSITIDSYPGRGSSFLIHIPYEHNAN